jgi:hypothetical protein
MVVLECRYGVPSSHDQTARDRQQRTELCPIHSIQLVLIRLNSMEGQKQPKDDAAERADSRAAQERSHHRLRT